MADVRAWRYGMGRKRRQQWYSRSSTEKDDIAGHYVFVCLCVYCAENLFTLLSLYPVHGTCFGGAAGVQKKKHKKTNTNYTLKYPGFPIFMANLHPSRLYIPCVCVCFAL